MTVCIIYFSVLNASSHPKPPFFFSKYYGSSQMDIYKKIAKTVG